MDANAWKVVFLLTLLSLTPLYAQETASEPYDGTTFALPFASYTPETRLMFGGLLVHQFKPRGAGADTRASQNLFSGMYTLNRQLIIEFIPNVIFPQEQWILDGAYQYSFFPDNYWGVGPLAREEDEMNVEYRRFNFQQSVLRKVGEGLYAGPRLRWSKVSKVEFTDQDDEQAPSAVIEGAEGSTLPGLGFAVRWDKRNSITFPTKNHYLELTALFYPEFLGASHPHYSWQLDGRKYLDLRNDRQSILAFHVRLRLSGGEIPFQEYAPLGGREIMRGYYEGRFRDANAAQVQAEWRRHVYWRFGIALFAATGEVWDKFGDLNLDNPKFAAGAGIRFNFNPEDQSNIRLDYGFGRHGGGLYVTVGEAF